MIYLDRFQRVRVLSKSEYYFILIQLRATIDLPNCVSLLYFILHYSESGSFKFSLKLFVSTQANQIKSEFTFIRCSQLRNQVEENCKQRNFA